MPAAVAADGGAVWNGSYAAGDACYCIGTQPAGTARRFVPTPIGGRTVASVCERIGPGPGLESVAGRFDRDVYPDPQCGHGPFAAGTTLIDADCAGTREPGGDDCRAVGPRWDLGEAFGSAADVDASVPADGTVLAAALPSAAPTVQIAGESWRKAPPGTATTGGPANSRIILDGEVWLKADDPAFAAADRLAIERARAARSVARVEPAPRRRAAPVASAPVDESPEALRARQRALVADARERAAARREAGLPSDELVVVDATPEKETPATIVPVEPVEPVEPVAAAAKPLEPEPVADDAAVDAATGQTDAAAAADGPATLSALRLPIDARPSSSDFGYVQAMPVSYDIGGAGVMLEGSAEMRNRFHVLARAGIANKYQEALLGAGMHYTPPNADRLTLLVTGGVEHGVFPLERVETGFQVDDASTGLFLHAASRLVLNPRFELEGGVGYSSFHEGDPIAFGGGFFHINDSVDLMSRFELGDQDSFGIGLRVYY